MFAASVIARRLSAPSTSDSTVNGSTSEPRRGARAPQGTFMNWLYRAVGFYNEESANDHIAIATFTKCRKQAHLPEFVRDFKVPDTYHATFQLVGLHAWLSHVRLRLEDPRRANHIASEIFEHWWHQAMLDMKERGVHDFLQISGSLKEMQQGFRGSAASYDAALKSDDTLGDLRGALFRNVYFANPGAEPDAARLAGYVEAQLIHMLSLKSETFMDPDPAAWAFMRPAAAGGTGPAAGGSHAESGAAGAS